MVCFKCNKKIDGYTDWSLDDHLFCSELCSDIYYLQKKAISYELQEIEKMVYQLIKNFK
jgi:hypothetical protein